MTLFNDDSSTKWFRHNSRLARFRTSFQGVDYWKKHWERDDKKAQLDDFVNKNSFGEYKRIFNKHLDKNGLILEAGCGTGYLVEVLRKRGFTVIGIDYEEKVVDYAKKKYLNSNFETGDINSLGFKDKSIQTYISLGVLEHFESGCDKALKEANRVLSDDGIALISVPYLNKARMKFLEQESAPFRVNEKYSFYQYYFSEKEFGDILLLNGFKVLDCYPLFPFHFLQREHPGFRSLWRHRLMRHRFRKFIKKNVESFPNRIVKDYAHMLMYICQKSDSVKL